MRCPSCGIEIQPGVANCPSCGRSLDTSETSSYYEDGTDSIPYVPYSIDLAGQTSTVSPVSTSGTAQQLLAQGTGLTPAANVQPLKQPEQSQHQGISKITGVLLTILILLAVISGSGVISYAAVFHPAELNAQATAVTRGLLTSQSLATATAIADSPQNTYDRIIHTTPIITDELQDQNHSLWTGNSNGSSNCSFTNGAYHIHVAPLHNFYDCLATGGFSNFVFRVQMTFISGDYAGIMFRSATSSFMSYLFTITNNGLYTLAVSMGPQSSGILAYGRSAAINSGEGRSNLLGVMALNNTISLFVNNQFITSVNDNTFNSGTFGLFGGNFRPLKTDVAYSNAQIWEIS
jgi:hypothetical protein